MKTNRRGFFKVLGVGVAATAVVKPVKAEKKAELISDTYFARWSSSVRHETMVSAASTLYSWDQENEVFSPVGEGE